MSKTILKFVGNENHGAYVHGVQRADLTQEDIDASGYTAEQLCAFQPPVFVAADKPVDAPTKPLARKAKEQ